MLLVPIHIKTGNASRQTANHLVASFAPARLLHLCQIMATRRLLLFSTTPHAVLAQLPPAEFAALLLFSSISAVPTDLTGNRIKHHRRDKRNSPGREKQEALEVGMAAYCTCMRSGWPHTAPA
jgi:hypothetical protein